MKNFVEFLRSLTNPAIRKETFNGENQNNPFANLEQPLRNIGFFFLRRKELDEKLKNAKTQQEALDICEMIEKHRVFPIELARKLHDVINGYSLEDFDDLKRYMHERTQFFRAVKDNDIQGVADEIGEPSLQASDVATQFVSQIEMEKSSEYDYSKLYDEQNNLKEDNEFSELEAYLNGYQSEKATIDEKTLTRQEFGQSYDGEQDTDTAYQEYLLKQSERKQEARERNEQFQSEENFKQIVEKVGKEKAQHFIETRQEFYQGLYNKYFSAKIENGSVVLPEQNAFIEELGGSYRMDELKSYIDAHTQLQTRFTQNEDENDD